MKRFALVGHPVAHSVSPEMHRAAYAALGVDASYEAIDCPGDVAVRAVVERLRRGELAGLNVTVPYKRLALELADRVDDLAESVAAANVLVLQAGRVVAYNTDVLALVDRFEALAPNARRFAILGSGGTALAAVRAAGLRGAERVVASARRFVGDVSEWPEVGGAERARWDDPVALAGSDCVVQATSAGMLGADPGESVSERVPWGELRAGAAALDVVYNPRLTPFLAAARARGLDAEGGLPMLVGQAVRAIELWLGRRAPASALVSAAERALGAS